MVVVRKRKPTLKIENARQLDAIKLPTAAYEISDAKAQGLALRILPSGAKVWSFRYRIGKRWGRIALGPYPEVTLADARDLAAEHLRSIKKGRDPSKEKRDLRNATAPDTLGQLMAQYLSEHALGASVGPRQTKRSRAVPLGTLLDMDGNAADIWSYEIREGKPKKRTWKVDRHLLDAEIPRAWRQRPATEITAREIHDLIKKKAATAPIQANRIRAILSKMFSFGIRNFVVTVNPVSGTQKPGEIRQRDRVLTEEEIRTFWRNTEPMSPAMRAFYRLRLVTAQRGGEVNSMRWEDIDLANAVWIISAERAKNGLSHTVPLSALAVEIISQLPRVGSFVIAGARGKRQQSEAARDIGVSDFQGHDLRRTAATNMASAGVTRFDVGKVLNHAERGVTAVYDRSTYDREKKTALDTWERKLRSILGLGEMKAALPFRKGGKR